MKKAIIIIAAVAILGALGIYSNNKKSTSALSTGGYSSGSSSTPATSSSSTQSSTVSYNDGTYKGNAVDSPYGTIQIAAVISGGKITDIKFLQMPYQEDHSKEVTSFAESPLKQSALNKQTARIDFVSGATDTSYGFEQSLQAALDQAANS